MNVTNASNLYSLFDDRSVLRGLILHSLCYNLFFQLFRLLDGRNFFLFLICDLNLLLLELLQMLLLLLLNAIEHLLLLLNKELEALARVDQLGNAPSRAILKVFFYSFLNIFLFVFVLFFLFLSVVVFIIVLFLVGHLP